MCCMKYMYVDSSLIKDMNLDKHLARYMFFWTRVLRWREYLVAHNCFQEKKIRLLKYLNPMCFTSETWAGLKNS